MQYYDTGWVGVLFTSVLVFFILFNIARAKSNQNLYIRRIAGLNAIDEAIGRSTEMGRPVLMVPGLGALNAISMQAVNIFAYITKTAARFSTPIRLCCGDAAVYTLAQEIIRDVYQSEGMIEQMHADSVQFVSDRQFAFAAGVSGIILREKTAASFFMGEFFAESLIFAETANSIGAIQVASSTQNTQTPFFIAACDYVLIGDEFYAASAYLTREPVLVGSLIGQDWCKVLVALSIMAGFLGNSVDLMANMQTTAKVDGLTTPLDTPRRKSPSELMFFKLLTPESPPPGVVVNIPFGSTEAYVTTRSQELGVPVVPGDALSYIDDVEGVWYSATVNGRVFRDFLVAEGDGYKVTLRDIPREIREPETPMAEGGK
ncbi:MAG: DUF6754 domain-containing protein [Fimbriimonadaceae bacterium]